MALVLVPVRDRLDVSSESPFTTKSSLQHHHQRAANLDASPFVFKRTVGYVGHPPQLLGTPSYPTPLDDIRVGHSYSNADATEPFRRNLYATPRSQVKKLRAEENALSGNLSLSPSRIKRRLLEATCGGSVVGQQVVASPPRMVQGESPPRFKGDLEGPHPQQTPGRTPRKSPKRNIDPTSILNPNKAVLTVDAQGKILIVNDMATMLLGEDLTRDGSPATLYHFLATPQDMQVVREILNPKKGKQMGAPPSTTQPTSLSTTQPTSLSTTPTPQPHPDTTSKNGEYLSSDVDVVNEDVMVLSGNVVTLVVEDEGGECGEELPVSLWMKELPVEEDEEARWIVVVEPITVVRAKLTMTGDGVIVSKDKYFDVIFGLDSTTDTDNDNLFNHVASIKDCGGGKGKVQECVDEPCTGRTREGETFPLSVSVGELGRREGVEADAREDALYEVKIKLFSNISGLVVVDGFGVILQYNHNFTRLLFGYGSKELEGQPINRIVPDFQTGSNTGAPRCENPFFCPNVDGGVTNPPPPVVVGTTTLCDVDESLKENSSRGKVELLKGDTTAKGADEGGERSTFVSSGAETGSRVSSFGSPNRAFVISDSQFTFSSSANVTSVKSGNCTGNQSTTNLSTTNQSTTNQSTSLKGESTAADFLPIIGGSPIRNSVGGTPAHVMRDITNSFNMFNMSEQPDQARFMSSNTSLITSTPASNKFSVGEQFAIQEGSHVSVGMHKDGTPITILYQIRRLSLKGRDRFCVWVTWEPSGESFGESSLLESSRGESGLLPVHSRNGSSSGVGGATSIKMASSFGSVTTCKDKTGSKSVLSPPTFAENEDENATEDDTSDVACKSRSSTTRTEFRLSTTSFCDGSEATDEEEEDDEEYDEKKDVDDNDTSVTSRSVTRTDGSSANEYSLSHSFAEAARMRSLSEGDVLKRGQKAGREHNTSLYEEPEWILISGEYSEHYAVLRQIGKGAFGYVKMSHRNGDGLIVITKFIKKSQVYKDSWTVDPKTGARTCLEVDLLLKLDHPNIVKALEYFENDKYFQLVMEKWGSGMDLFEFIDRNPALDEPLTSYIFRQIVSPLLYLGSLGILHRDIKDENIIIDHLFRVKLIDFGSATYLEPGTKFSRFAGTIEYCSPEVLKGQKYSGPELEVWSLGITLYTLVFGENPFSVVEQVLKDPVVMPINYSDDLFNLLDGMLHKSPKKRMKLNEVAEHPWTMQEVDMEMYAFEDIVPCDEFELSPVEYIQDYGVSEESLSTTSSSFVYEDRHSLSANNSSSFLFRSTPPHPNSSFVPLRPHSRDDDDEGTDTDDVTSDGGGGGGKSDVVTATASSTRTSTASQSSVTIDSSMLFSTPRAKGRQKKCSTSSISDTSDVSLTGKRECGIVSA